jgi:hypothetical protein
MEVLHPRCCGLDVHKETVVEQSCGTAAVNQMFGDPLACARNNAIIFLTAS